MTTSSEDVVKMTSDHLVLVGIPDHKTFTTKVLGDHTWEVLVTSPREVPVVHRVSFLESPVSSLLVMSCFKRPLLLTDFLLQVRAWQIQGTLDTPVKQKFRR